MDAKKFLRRGGYSFVDSEKSFQTAKSIKRKDLNWMSEVIDSIEEGNESQRASVASSRDASRTKKRPGNEVRTKISSNDVIENLMIKPVLQSLKSKWSVFSQKRSMLRGSSISSELSKSITSSYSGPGSSLQEPTNTFTYIHRTETETVD